jgi:hypothetical protein
LKSLGRLDSTAFAQYKVEWLYHHDLVTLHSQPGLEPTAVVLLVFNEYISKNRESSVGIASDYGLDDWMIGVQIPVGAGSFSL